MKMYFSILLVCFLSVTSQASTLEKTLTLVDEGFSKIISHKFISSQNRNYLILRSENDLTLYSLDGKSKNSLEGCRGGLTSCLQYGFAPKENLLVTISQTKANVISPNQYQLNAYDVTNARRTQVIEGVDSFAISPSGLFLAVKFSYSNASAEKGVRVYRASKNSTWELVREIENAIRFGFTPVDDVLMVQPFFPGDGKVKFVHVESGETLAEIVINHNYRLYDFSPTGKYLRLVSYSSAHGKKTVYINTQTYKPVLELNSGNSNEYLEQDFSPDDKYLVVKTILDRGYVTKLDVYSLDSGYLVKSFPSLVGPINSVKHKFSRNSDYLNINESNVRSSKILDLNTNSKWHSWGGDFSIKTDDSSFLTIYGAGYQYPQSRSVAMTRFPFQCSLNRASCAIENFMLPKTEGNWFKLEAQEINEDSRTILYYKLDQYDSVKGFVLVQDL